MNLNDFCFWGIGQISSFTHLVFWLCGSFFEIFFIVWVLNVAFSIFKSCVMHLAGVKNNG
ncbi:MAG: hypothetical protein K2N06_03590 [Oscillospiraceae bacterium]|nr:hypothetical protein [Oscillospiraceae bacterium]